MFRCGQGKLQGYYPYSVEEHAGVEMIMQHEMQP